MALSGVAIAEPNQTYLTYSGDPETSIDINLVVERRVPKVMVYLDTQSRDGKREAYAQQIQAKYHQTLLELNEENCVYVVQLTDLTPDTVYYFVAGDEKYGYTEERSFRTLPGGDAPIRFASGGDMGTGTTARKLLELTGEQDPHFAVVGGDLAYANGNFAEARDWTTWFKNWDKYCVTPDGHMVPMVMGIGNHEVNDFVSDDDRLRSPFYTSFFGRQADDIYYVRKFGDNMVFLMLDSGHLNPHHGEQTDWLKQQLETHRDVPYRFATYHIPLYPAHRDYEGAGSKAGRKNWGPLFDEYGLTIGFENHDHVLKRTKPIKGNEVASEGTIYVGDGTYGVSPRDIDKEPRWYNEVEGSIAHFWLVDVATDSVKLKAISAAGKVVDSFSVK
jgi:hypothetical protein